jgi:hypothetical protein
VRCERCAGAIHGGHHRWHPIPGDRAPGLSGPAGSRRVGRHRCATACAPPPGLGRATPNGDRERVVSTRAGDLILVIPKLRQGGFFPAGLEPRRRLDKALDL